MVRIVKHDAQGPKEVKTEHGGSVWACMCGLSRNKPLCDGSHKKAKDEKEGVIYSYDKDLNRIEMNNKY